MRTMEVLWPTEPWGYILLYSVQGFPAATNTPLPLYVGRRKARNVITHNSVALNRI
jgi:hypothetical protein